MATKVELQEKALQLEVAIYHPGDDNGSQKELTKAELEAAIAEKTEELQAAHAAEQVAAEEARQPLPVEEETPAPRPRRKRGPVVADPDPARLKALGLRAPTDKDRALAKKHSYPVAVPGGRAYQTAVSFNCSVGGHLVPLGSVVILTDDQADHKAEFITAI